MCLIYTYFYYGGKLKKCVKLNASRTTSSYVMMLDTLGRLVLYEICVCYLWLHYTSQIPYLCPHFWANSLRSTQPSTLIPNASFNFSASKLTPKPNFSTLLIGPTHNVTVLNHNFHFAWWNAWTKRYQMTSKRVKSLKDSWSTYLLCGAWMSTTTNRVSKMYDGKGTIGWGPHPSLFSIYTTRLLCYLSLPARPVSNQ